MDEGSKKFRTLMDDYDLVCDDLLQEIAICSVEGLLVDSDDDEFDQPITPDNGCCLVHNSFVSGMTPMGFEQESTCDWSSDASYFINHPPAPRPETVEVTTVMLRNIPNKYTRAGLLHALTDLGFEQNSCNNLYLPMDADSGCNLGYAFLNFVSHGHALEFKKAFDGCRLPSSGSRKICSVVWANKQGLFQFANTNSQLLPLDPYAMPPLHHTTSPGRSMIEQYESICHLPTKIFIGGLPVSTTDEDLLEYFGRFGPMKECNVIIDRETGLSRGFGFVNFVHQESVRIVDEAQMRRPHVINCRVVSIRFYGAREAY
jgi:hypothetical protein